VARRRLDLAIEGCGKGFLTRRCRATISVCRTEMRGIETVHHVPTGQE